MAYRSLEECLDDLEQREDLLRITEEVDPNLVMAAIHLKVHAAGGPAILFEKVKGTKFRAASNIFGTLERSEYLFRKSIPVVKKLIDLKNDPAGFFKNFLRNFSLLFSALKALPKKNAAVNSFPFEEIKISELPLIKHWPEDGGAFVTLPQVYTEDPDSPGISNANIGMYRIQLNGNDYKLDEEIGLHYQLHRGIGVHQTKANRKGEALKVSVFIGGPPAHSVAAVMPLPEGLSEASFAGVLGGRRFRYVYRDGFAISTDADFVITGTVQPNENKQEGPFGDHLGYYSLKHDFPLLRVHKVYAKKNAIWPFTVVGRPPQEDTSFGELIHKLTGKAIEAEIPGLKEVHAVDAAGVHPLLLAVGSERYTPYHQTKSPAEILTIANHILGTGQLSLAKFLFITAANEVNISASDIPNYLQYFLERIDLQRDVHFYTNTTIDTLDYSGSGLNSGSKVVLAAFGDVKRNLASVAPATVAGFKVRVCLPGVIAVEFPTFTNYEAAGSTVNEFAALMSSAPDIDRAGMPLIVLTEDADFLCASLNNFLWVTFTRTNPSHDMYGVNSRTDHKHWGCDNLIVDARIKPFHAPRLKTDPAADEAADHILANAGFKASL